MSVKKSKPKRTIRHPVDRSEIFEKLLQNASAIERYQLRLYITGSTARSAQAIENIRSLCEEYLPGRYDLEVVDIYQQPGEAAKQQIIAAPTLIKQLPVPSRRFVGNLSDRDKVLIGLDLAKSKDSAAKTKPTHWIKI
jgi:circadian clock protein KaiB